MPLLFVYGTLRSGGEANNLLAEQEILKKSIKVHGYRLYDYFGKYPFAVQAGEEEFIIGDIYNVNENLLPVLDRYEGSLYERHFDKVQSFFIYIKRGGSKSSFPKIPEGDWLVYTNQRKDYLF